MSIHLHRAREWTAWILTAMALSPVALCFASTGTAGPVGLAEVSGRLTIAGRPADGVFICLDRGLEHCAFGWVHRDGKFRLSNMEWYNGGAEPGAYHVHLYASQDGPKFPAKYRDPKTSEIELLVGDGWNDFQIDLR